jgi:hypothetical protein
VFVPVSANAETGRISETRRRFLAASEKENCANKGNGQFLY